MIAGTAQVRLCPRYGLQSETRYSGAGIWIAAYQACGYLPVAGEHAFVLLPSEVTCATREVGTSAHAVCGPILTSKSRCFCRCAEEHSGTDENKRKEKVPCHGLTSTETSGPRQTLTPSEDKTYLFSIGPVG